MSGVLLIFSASFLWALDTLIRYPLMGQGIPAAIIVGIEHWLLMLCLLPFYIRHLKTLGDLKLSSIGAFVMVGGLGSALATLCFTRAMGLINPSVVILLQKLQPVIAIILAHFVLKESIRPKFALWALLAMAGAILVGHRELRAGLEFIVSGQTSLGESGAQGIVLTVIAAFGWGASTVFGKVLSNRGVSEWGLIAGRNLVGGLILTPLVLNSSTPVLEVGTVVWGKILIMALVSGLLAMYLYYQGLKRLSARLSTLAEMFFPFCAVIVNWVFLDAELAPEQLLGGGLLIFSSGVIQWKKY